MMEYGNAQDRLLDTTEVVKHRFVEALQSFERGWDAAAPLVNALYDDNVSFVDPLVDVRGLDQVLEVCRVMCARASSIRVKTHTVRSAGPHLFVTWTIDYRFKFGPTMHVDGCTHAQVEGERILRQRDYWDVAGAFASAVPVAGRLYRTLTHAGYRLSKPREARPDATRVA